MRRVSSRKVQGRAAWHESRQIPRVTAHPHALRAAVKAMLDSR